MDRPAGLQAPVRRLPAGNLLEDTQARAVARAVVDHPLEASVLVGLLAENLPEGLVPVDHLVESLQAASVAAESEDMIMEVLGHLIQAAAVVVAFALYATYIWRRQVTATEESKKPVTLDRGEDSPSSYPQSPLDNLGVGDTVFLSVPPDDLHVERRFRLSEMEQLDGFQGPWTPTGTKLLFMECSSSGDPYIQGDDGVRYLMQLRHIERGKIIWLQLREVSNPGNFRGLILGADGAAQQFADAAQTETGFYHFRWGDKTWRVVDENCVQWDAEIPLLSGEGLLYTMYAVEVPEGTEDDPHPAVQDAPYQDSAARLVFLMPDAGWQGNPHDVLLVGSPFPEYAVLFTNQADKLQA